MTTKSLLLKDFLNRRYFKMKLMDCIKFGFGFYVGYETAKEISKVVKEVYPILKKRIKEGHC